MSPPAESQSIRLNPSEIRARAREHDWDEDIFEVTPARRPERPWLRVTLAACACIAALSYLAQQRLPSSDDTLPVEQRPVELLAPPPEWQPVVRPTAHYLLALADLKLPVPALEARQHVSGGREDVFTAGAIEGAMHLHLVIRQAVQDERTSGSFYVDLVRQAAGAGLSVLRSAQPTMVATKFGRVEVADAVLGHVTEHACLAFRFAHPEFAFRFHGWLCGSDERPADRHLLACVIDRLALSDVGDQSLKALFSQADRQRSESCRPASRTASAR